MKTLVLVATIYMGTTVAALCDFGELPSQLGDIVEPAFKCQTASGYSFVQPSTLPTAAQLKAICSECKTLVTTITNAKDDLPTCALSMDDGSSVTVNNLLTGVVTQCTRGVETPTSGGSSSTSSGGDTKDKAPAATPIIPIPTIAPSDKPTITTPSPAKSSDGVSITTYPSSTFMNNSTSDSSALPTDEDTHDTNRLGGSMDHDLTRAPPLTNANRTINPPSSVKTATSAATYSHQLTAWSFMMGVVVYMLL